MNLVTVKNAVTSKVGRQILVGQKHSPTLLFVGGVVGVVATSVLACRATLKVEEVLEQADHKKALADGLRHKDYSESDRLRDHNIIKVQTAVKIGKLYAPSVIVGVASVAALTGSHVILKRRNVALMAAYSTIAQGFEEYRKRVIDDVGAEKDLEYRHGLHDEQIHDTEKGVVQNVKIPDGKSSIYARCFAKETSKSWEPTPMANQFFIQCQQNYANDKLRSRGHVFLNEVYDSLGLERSPEGAVVGWVKGNGDDYIDFGIFDGNLDSAERFVKGYENSIWLDFNVDGTIWNKI